jgi:hypothetical protein
MLREVGQLLPHLTRGDQQDNVKDLLRAEGHFQDSHISFVYLLGEAGNILYELLMRSV